LLSCEVISFINIKGEITRDISINIEITGNEIILTLGNISIFLKRIYVKTANNRIINEELTNPGPVSNKEILKMSVK
jgi:hypothetical protein